jgi:hypothetical protein
VVRSETVVTAFRIVSNALQAENVTTEILSTVVKALPQGDALDLIVGTKAMYDALRSCADIVLHGWDVNQYCQYQGWREVMAVWKGQKVNATIRVFEDDGVDAENGPFQALAMKEAIQAVKDGMHDRELRGLLEGEQ